MNSVSTNAVQQSGDRPSRRTLLSIGGSAAFWASAGRLQAAIVAPEWSTTARGYRFTWRLTQDRAELKDEISKEILWTGGLLPAFVYQTQDGKTTYAKTAVDLSRSSLSPDGGKLALATEFLDGQLQFRATEYGLEMTELSIVWKSHALPLISLYFGTALLSPDETAAAPALDEQFWPNWEASCFCIPAAKGNPIQSVLRRWDLGNAHFPIGSFGPSLGTPYAAAYPRPLYAAALGGQSGWLCVGPGTIPNGAMSLSVRSSAACLQILYREDLWGAPQASRRIWPSPLRLAWAKNPWLAYRALFASFGIDRLAQSPPLRPQWNSWGDFRKNVYDLRGLADWTKNVGAQILGLDDRWETFVGSGEPDRNRFPNFDTDLQYIKSLGLDLGFWQSVGWIDRPESVGLRSEDLIVGIDGRPRRVSWDMNPRSRGHYCLDPSSVRTVEFLRRRTIDLMRRYQPVLLKLDFGYGLPSPNIGAPRDPALRGERYSLRLLELIAEAARSVNSNVAIEYYSLHPLVRTITDVVALDDLGDAGNHEAEGHRQWSIWAALGATKSNIMASSGYSWNQDADVVLNSAAIGVPGAVLSRTMDDGSSVPSVYINRRIALNRWYRKTTEWFPMWLTSSPGGYLEDPQLRSFGRLEMIRGEPRLTAVVLREEDQPDEKRGQLPPAAIRGMAWRGSWALISQDNLDIFESRCLACLPTTGTDLQIPLTSPPDKVLLSSRNSDSLLSRWNWSAGKLTLQKPDSDDFLGFLIIRT